MQRKSQILVHLLITTSFLAVFLSLFFLPTPASAEVYALSGNLTLVDRVGFPIEIEENQIQLGETWTCIYNLEGGHKYHIFLMGEWVNLEDHLTDYDIYLYRARTSVLNFISSHTEAAGYPRARRAGILPQSLQEPFMSVYGMIRMIARKLKQLY